MAVPSVPYADDLRRLAPLETTSMAMLHALNESENMGIVDMQRQEGRNRAGCS